MFLSKNTHLRQNNANNVFNEKRMIFKETPNIPTEVAKPGIIKRFGKWLVTPEKIISFGTVARLPLMAAWYPLYGGVKALKWSGDKIYNTGKESIQKHSLYQPGINTLKESKNIPFGVANIAGGPFLEAGKGWMRSLKYGLWDNAMTSANTILSVPSAGINSTIDAGIETIKSPYNIAAESVRGAVDATFKGPKEILTGDIRGGLKTIFGAPLRPLKAMAKVPLSIANIPFSIGKELALTGTGYAVNTARAVYAPVDGIVDGYKRQHKGLKQLEGFKNIFRKVESDKFRDRFSAIFKNEKPFASDFALT